jgi:hypothetical protein
MDWGLGGGRRRRPWQAGRDGRKDEKVVGVTTDGSDFHGWESQRKVATTSSRKELTGAQTRKGEVFSNQHRI